MVSLTPGTLQKLLQNAGDKEFRVAGEHRSALLQASVISIVPSLEEDPWKSRGYYLRVSDSLHSAYVSVSDEDVELILSDMVQLGQFIAVTWLDSGTPVPVLRGIKPIPKRRPCVGDPKDLISSDFLNAKKVETKAKSKGKVKKVVGNEEGSLRRLSFGNGKVGGGMDSRRLSLDSARRGWDSGPQSKNGAKSVSKSKLKDSSSPSGPVVAKKAVPEDSPKKSSFSPLKSKNIIVSPNLPVKPVKSMKSSNDASFPVNFNKVVLSSTKKSEQRILWDALPSTICNLGKEVRSYRKLAVTSAVHALEEASISECVIRCTSMFAELCELSEKDTSGPLVEQFLSIHESIKKASEVISTLIIIRSSDANDGIDFSSQGSESGICFTPVSKNASLWVQAAIETDLSKFTLYRKGGEKGITNSEKCHYVVIENYPEKIDTDNCSTKIKQSPRSSKAVPKVKNETSHMPHSRRRVSPTKVTGAEQGAMPPASGLKHVAKLAEKLLSFSRSWFFDYLEVSLNHGFGLRRDDTSQMAVLLGQLKRVNQWLDGAFQGDEGGEKIEKLRKKLYRFLLDNVDSAVSNK
ncbi:hypothetical protein C2S51_022044 [Perilla frutescens var. frutescens]|nr:hypothetical protein C2S51_022044 [Perilla frutescens var. frutescens]